MYDPNEVAAAVLEPHFDAVRDIFVEHHPEPSVSLERLRHTRFVVDPEVHDTARHFAACRDDGLLIKLAPEATELSLDELVAILCHEFGHAADYAYPGSWITPAGGRLEALWIGEREDKPARRWRRSWHSRADDAIEWAADSIAFQVTQVRVRYCGPCMIQCFRGSELRAAGLR